MLQQCLSLCTPPTTTLGNLLVILPESKAFGGFLPRKWCEDTDIPGFKENLSLLDNNKTTDKFFEIPACSPIPFRFTVACRPIDDQTKANAVAHISPNQENFWLSQIQNWDTAFQAKILASHTAKSFLPKLKANQTWLPLATAPIQGLLLELPFLFLNHLLSTVQDNAEKRCQVPCSTKQQFTSVMPFPIRNSWTYSQKSRHIWCHVWSPHVWTMSSNVLAKKHLIWTLCILHALMVEPPHALHNLNQWRKPSSFALTNLHWRSAWQHSCQAPLYTRIPTSNANGLMNNCNLWRRWFLKADGE